MGRLSSSAPPIRSNGWDGDRLYQQAPGEQKLKCVKEMKKGSQQTDKTETEKPHEGCLMASCRLCLRLGAGMVLWGLNRTVWLVGRVGGWKASCHSKLMTEILIRSNNVSP